jgi:hypothetical protein
MDWGKRTAGLFIALAASVGMVVPSVHAADAMALKLGQAVYWSGPYVASASVANDNACTPATCPTYPLTLAPGAARLRVAIDHPNRENSFTLEVLDPKGEVAGSLMTSNQFAGEVLIPKPAAGAWAVRVVPSDVTASAFRLRAKLERVVPKPPAGKVAMLPNLRTVPPYEFGFIAPANPLNAVYPPDTVNPPLDVAGLHPLSCAADEMAPVAVGGGGATKCLRLTSGPMNIGSGPFEILFDFASDTATGKVDPTLLQGPARQVIHYADGTTSERAAGTYSFHKTHAHFHTDQILTYELFSVADQAKGGLTPAGVGTKSGFCPADQLFGDWHSFGQMPPGTFGEGDSATGGSCFSPEGGRIGLSTGWGDVYRWQRPGQYVEFGGQPDGVYVVRTTADIYDHVLEENENDNASYALIRVTGEKVDILERGWGSDPWDTHKVVFRGLGPSAQELGGPTTYVEEAAATPAVPVGSKVADLTIENGTLPRTGATHETLAATLAVLSLCGVALRRRLLAH